jgi:hypothetical protein
MPFKLILPTIKEEDKPPIPKVDNFFSPRSSKQKTYYAYLPGDVDIYLKENTLKSIKSLPRENFFEDGKSALAAARNKFSSHAITLFIISIAKNELTALPEKTKGQIKIIWNFNLIDHLKGVIGISRGKNYSEGKIYEFSSNDLKKNRERENSGSTLENLDADKESRPSNKR